MWPAGNSVRSTSCTRWRFAERQDVLVAFARQARLHQARGALGDDDFLVRRDVIAVRVRNEGEALRVPRIEPQILRGQINAALVTNIDHARIYARGIRPTKAFIRPWDLY